MAIHLQTIDCVDGLCSLDFSSVDLCVTSPPYNLGIKYSTHQDDEERSLYLQWLREVSLHLTSVLKDDGSLFLNIGSSPSNPYLPFEVVHELRKIFVLQNTIHWIKSITVGDQSSGNFKPINSPRFLTDCHEYLFHFTKTGNVPIDRLAVGTSYQDKSNLKRGTRGKNGDRRCRGNNLFIPYETIQFSKDRPHPAAFPVALVEYCIRLHGGDPTQTVMLDPFVGIGTSAQAARNLNIGTFHGFDIDAGYIAEAKQRLNQ